MKKGEGRRRPILEREDAIEFSEEIERSWREYITDFKRDVYPMFEAEGFTLPEAMHLWDLNKLAAEIRALGGPS